MSTLFKKFFSATLFVFVIEPCLSQPPSVQWNRTYGGSLPELHSVVIQTADGGYLSAGSSRSGISGLKSQPNWDGSMITSDYWLVKSDASGNLQWEKRFGGTGQDVCTSLLQTIDNGYLIGGYSSSSIGGDKTSPQIVAMDYWIIKLDATGTKQWENTYGGDGNDYLSTVIQHSTGGFLLLGFTTSGISGNKSEASRGANDYWVVCTDALGNQLWDKTFGGTENDYAKSVIQTIDGGYLLSGNSQSGISGDKTENNRGINFTSDYWVVKIDEIGNKQWDKRFGSADDDILSSVIQLNDGSYILGGHSNGGAGFDKSVGSRGGYDYWVVKTNSGGAKVWDRRYGGATTDYLYSIQSTTDGGFLFAGSSDSPLGGDKSENSRGQEDYWIIKSTSTGSKQWDKTIGGSDEDWLSSARQTTDGGYILGGRSNSHTSGDKTENSFGNTDFWIVKLGPPSPLPVQLVDFSGSQENGRILLRWSTASEINNSHFTIEKLDGSSYHLLNELPGSGNTTSMQYYQTYDESPDNGNNFYRLTQTDYDGRSEVFGPISIKYAKDGKLILTAYPNPAINSLNVTWNLLPEEEHFLMVTDFSGKCVYKERMNKGTNYFSIPVQNFAKGLYVVSLENEISQVREKFEIR